MSEKQPETAALCPAGVLFEILQYLAGVGSNGAGDPSNDIGDPRATELALKLEGIEVFDLADLQIRYREDRVIVRVHCLTDDSLREVEFPEATCENADCGSEGCSRCRGRDGYEPSLTPFQRLAVLEDETKRNRADLLMQARRLEKVEHSLRLPKEPALPEKCFCGDPKPGRIGGYCLNCGMPLRRNDG